MKIVYRIMMEKWYRREKQFKRIILKEIENEEVAKAVLNNLREIIEPDGKDSEIYMVRHNAEWDNVKIIKEN